MFSSTYVVAGLRIRIRPIVLCCISATLQSNKYAPQDGGEMGEGGIPTDSRRGTTTRWLQCSTSAWCGVRVSKLPRPIPNFASLCFILPPPPLRRAASCIVSSIALVQSPNNVLTHQHFQYRRQPHRPPANQSSVESLRRAPRARRACLHADRAPPQHREASSVARNARVVVYPRFPRQPEPRTPPPPTPNPANAPPGPPPICGPSPGPETGLLNPGGLPWKDVR